MRYSKEDWRVGACAGGCFSSNAYLVLVVVVRPEMVCEVAVGAALLVVQLPAPRVRCSMM